MSEAIPTEFAFEAEATASILDQLDYFQVLKVNTDASIAELRAAFHRESRTWHPDRLFHVPDEQLKERVNRVYKRITEAWTILRDERMRAKYLEDISGPQRERKLRWTEESEQERKRAREEEVGTTPNGRRYYAAGTVDLQAGRAESALRNFKAALVYEPQNERYRAAIEEAQRLAAQAS